MTPQTTTSKRLSRAPFENQHGFGVVMLGTVVATATARSALAAVFGEAGLDEAGSPATASVEAGFLAAKLR